ncbi:MAG: Dna2/Cas4 domain-containing protein [Streptosporangiales bacterium]|nr:Dna2/Cas4 domain-containing protein [Streptosporangiales bacterium]
MAAETADGEVEAVEPVEPRPPTLSPSRAGDFMTCPLLFRFRVIDKLPEQPSTAAARGTVVHSVLERLYDLPPADRTLAQATELIGPRWDALVEAEPGLAELFDAEEPAERDAWLAGARDLLATYFDLEDPSRLEPAERELYVETVLESGLRLRGYVDRLDIAPTGEVRIVDYKTGKAPSELFEAKAMFQMRFYALVLWRQLGRMPRLLQLMYLGNGEVLRYQPDEHDLLATQRKIEALWQAIERAMERQDWRPRQSRLCDWCSFQALCPEFGGTPPPLPTPEVTDAADPLADAPSPRRSPDEI